MPARFGRRAAIRSSSDRIARPRLASSCISPPQSRRNDRANLRPRGRRPNTPSNIIPAYWSPDGQVVFSQATMDAGYGIWTSSIDRRIPRPSWTRTIQRSAGGSLSGRPLDGVRLRSVGPLRDLCAGLPGRRAANAGLDQRRHAAAVAKRWTRAVLHPTRRLAHAGRCQAGERFDAAAPTVLFKTAIPTMLNPYRMDYVPAADGQRFLMKVPVKETPPAITVVLNWPALLSRN